MSFLKNNSKYTVAFAWVSFWFAIWVCAFYPALITAKDVWVGSNTFTHCFFVLPGALYLVWRDRQHFLQLEPKANYWALLPVSLLLLVGLIGSVAGINLLTHIAAFAILPLLVFMLLGGRIAWVLRFPLLFVLFSIPFGEELVPFFQQLTASMAVAMLEWVHIPVLKNGLYLEIPAGRFVVAEACSGIRFFIAMVAFGAIYVHLSFKGFKRKALFMCIAILLPIVANGFRVFGIILVAHYTEMEYAVGADHLVYGWVFFAFIMLVFVAIGERWRDVPVSNKKVEQVEINPRWKQRNWLVSGVIGALPLIVFAVLQEQLNAPGHQDRSEIDRDSLASVIVREIDYQSWMPEFFRSNDIVYAELDALYPAPIQLYMAWYAGDSRDSELISYKNKLYGSESWTLIENKRITFGFTDSLHRAYRSSIAGAFGSKRIIIYWYKLKLGNTSSSMMAKLLQALDKITGGQGGGGVIAVSIPFDSSAIEAEQVLLSYIKNNYKLFEEALPF